MKFNDVLSIFYVGRKKSGLALIGRDLLTSDSGSTVVSLPLSRGTRRMFVHAVGALNVDSHEWLLDMMVLGRILFDLATSCHLENLQPQR